MKDKNMIYNEIKIIKEPAVEVKTPVGYLYRIVNNINGKTYVGRRNLSYDKSWRQYMGSGQLIKNAISKYGAEHFTKEFLGYYYDTYELSIAEDKLILSEWAKGKCEYNLGTTPPPDTVRFMPEEKLIERSRKLSEAAKKYHQNNPNSGYFYERSQKLQLEYNIFIDNYGDKIIELFKNNPNAAKIAKELNISRKWVIRFLKENNYTLQARNEYKATNDTKNKLSLTTITVYINNNPDLFSPENSLEDNLALYYNKEHLQKTCANNECKKEFVTEKKKQQYCSNSCRAVDTSPAKKISYDTMYYLYIIENLSVQKIADKLGMGRGTIYNRLKELNISK